MNDSEILHDAFRGFEHQADRISEARAATGEAVGRTVGAGVSRKRMLSVATAAAAVAAVATGVALFASGGGSDGRRVAAGDSTISRSSSSPSSATASAPPTSALTSPAATAAHHVPGTRREMVAAFKRALGSTATFTVTQSQGNYLMGILTAGGHRGGFDIQAYDGTPGDPAQCEDAATSHCTVRSTSNGGSLATGHESVGGSVLYLVNYVGPDGSGYVWHLSTSADPKSGGDNVGSKPPLTIAQMVTILESDRW